MIAVTLLNKQEIIINAELIETVEAAHDTIITLTTGRKIAVVEPPDEVVRRVVQYRNNAYASRIGT